MPRVLVLLVLCIMLVPCPAAHGIGLPPGTSIQLIASADFTNALGEAQSATPASITLTVAQMAGVDINWDPPQEATTRGQDIYIPLRITNTGNGIDRFNLAVSSTLGWATSIIYDDNNDGVHQDSETSSITDTSLIADGYCPCFARLSVPPDASSGDSITVTAISDLDPVVGKDSVVVSVPSPGLRATKLTADASPAAPYVGQTVTVQGALTPAAQQPLSIIIVDPLDMASASSCNTQTDGTYQFSFVPSKAGTYAMTISFAGATDYASTSVDLNVEVSDKITTTIDMASSPASLLVGDTTNISGTIRPAMQTSISLTCTSPLGVVTQAQTQSDQTGAFTWSKVVDEAGQWVIDASYVGSAIYTSSTKSLPLQVSAGQVAHAVTISSGPTINPTTVVTPETTQCKITAVDSLGHGIDYLWSDGGAGGTFTPGANVKEPVYTAAANNAPQDIQVTLTCTATCTDGSPTQASGSAVLTVRSVDTVRSEVKYVSPQLHATLVEIGALVVLQFNKSMDQQTTQSAISIVPTVAGCTYTWSSDNTTVSIQHTPFSPDTTYACTISADAKDTSGLSLLGAYQWTFTTVPGVRFDPNEIGARPSTTFATPHIIVSDPAAPGGCSVQVSVPQGLTVDTTLDNEGNLSCVRKGADVTSITSSWDSSNRVVTISGVVTTPGPKVEVVKSIRLTTPSTSGSLQVLLNETPSLTVRVGNTQPGDFNGDGVINITDAGWFVQEYVRWRQTPAPTFDGDVDTPYDLAPHTAGVWPNWSPVGDQTIDTLDASAFMDCWTTAHNQQQITSSGVYQPVAPSRFTTDLDEGGNMLVVTVKDVRYGAFEISVPIPESAKLSSSLDHSGNVASVMKLGGAGNLLFSEYDPESRCVRIVGTVTGTGSVKVAEIKFSK